MRKLMWFTLGFTAACAFCAYFWPSSGVWAACAVLAGLSVLLLSGGKRLKWMRILGTALLGCAVGLTWFQLFHATYLRAAAELDGEEAEVTAQCTDYSEQTGYGTAVDGVVRLNGKPYRVRFYVNGEIEMEPGDTLSGVFRFRVTTPDGKATFHRGSGIFLLAYQQADAQLGKMAYRPFWAFPAIWRHEITRILDDSFPADTAGFAKALLLGDRSGIDYATSTAFKVSGISHIIAVSGLHVTILFTLIYLLCFKRRWLTALIGIPSLVLFAAVAGFSPSVTRASLMMILMLLAMLFDREYDGPTELAFSCLVMLFVNPLVITSASFQLSVGCMVGIFLFQRRIFDFLAGRLHGDGKNPLSKIKRWAAGSVSVTLSAMVFTTPLAAWYFGAVSLVGVLTNLLTLWVISLIFYGTMLVCLAGWLWPAAGAFLAGIFAWPIRYVLSVAGTLAAFPLAAVYTRSIYIVAWLGFVYVLLSVFLLQKNRKPGLLACCGAVGLCLALAASWADGLFDQCRMTVLDVGQGQSILLESGKKTFLVDCGGSDGEDAADLAAETLLSRGISRLDGIILTHFDRDHAGGMSDLLTRIPADVLFVPDVEEETGIDDALELQMEGRTVRVSRDLELAYGDVSISIYAPVLRDSGNESSLAVLFRAQNCDILITGDRSSFGERMLLKTAALPELEVLVVGHHGSKNSACRELLEATKPNLAVISVGENPYGLPASETLERLYDAGCVVYRTDLQGNIVFRR